MSNIFVLFPAEYAAVTVTLPFRERYDNIKHNSKGQDFETSSKRKSYHTRKGMCGIWIISDVILTPQGHVIRSFITWLIFRSDFLAQLRSYYLDRENSPAFWSVILAGVYDIKNIKNKIRADGEHKLNSPWNIASDFRVNMSFTRNGIEGMLEEYEADNHTGMDVGEIAELIFEYTSGYPFLVSRLCKLMDEEVAGSVNFPDEAAAWTKEGFLEAEKLLLSEKNTLFESLMGKLHDYPSLKRKLYAILFGGKKWFIILMIPQLILQ